MRVKTKILSLILIISMALTLLPFAVNADGNTYDGNYKDDNYYDDDYEDEKPDNNNPFTNFFWMNMIEAANTPRIETKTIVEGVMFVPYSHVIECNLDNSNVAFTVIDGNLPNDIILKSNGEIYGLPTEIGKFTFTVEAVYTGATLGGRRLTDRQEYTLVVLENTDENVNAVNTDEQGYAVLDWVASEIWLNADGSYDSEVFRSEGPFGDFIAFYIDGQELTEGEDYFAEEGSTRITVRSQTFQNAGEGKHTIAAEFRSDGNEDGEMKRTAQNVYVKNEVENEASFDDNISGDNVDTAKQYSIIFNQNEGGKVQIVPEVALAGTVVTVTIIPENDYEFSSIATSAGVELIKKGTNKYTFTMPTEQVLITVEFALSDYNNIDLPYNDVMSEDWFYNNVCYAYERGLIDGSSSNQFSPDISASRGTIATALYRMMGEPDVETSNVFSDVEIDSEYEKAVIWAYEKKIMEGYGDGTFGVNAPITREQMAAILYRYASYSGYDTTSSVNLRKYEDADKIDAYAVTAMEWANAEGLIIGTTDTTLSPDDEITRAQVVTILARFSRKLAQ